MNIMFYEQCFNDLSTDFLLLRTALCSVDVARQSRDMVDDMLEEMASNPAHTVDMVLDYNGRTSGPALGWGDEESLPVPASPKGFTSSLCAIKNGRKTMEDRHIIIHDLNKALGLTVRLSKKQVGMDEVCYK